MVRSSRSSELSTSHLHRSAVKLGIANRYREEVAAQFFGPHSVEEPPWGDGEDLRRGMQRAAAGTPQGIDALEAAAAMMAADAEEEAQQSDSGGRTVGSGSAPSVTELHASGALNKKIAEEIGKDLPYVRQKLERQQCAVLVFFSGLPPPGAAGLSGATSTGGASGTTGSAPNSHRGSVPSAGTASRPKVSIFDAFTEVAYKYFEETVVAEAAQQQNEGGRKSLSRKSGGGGARVSADAQVSGFLAGSGANKGSGAARAGTSPKSTVRPTFSVTRPSANVLTVKCFFAGQGSQLGGGAATSSQAPSTSSQAPGGASSAGASAWLENGFGASQSQSNSTGGNATSSLFASQLTAGGAGEAAGISKDGGAAAGAPNVLQGQLTVLHVDYQDRTACSRICEVIAGLQKRKKHALGFNFDTLEAISGSGAGGADKDVNAMSPGVDSLSGGSAFGSEQGGIFGMGASSALGALGAIASSTAVPIASPDVLSAIDTTMRTMVHNPRSAYN